MISTWPNRLCRTGSGQLDINWSNFANNVKYVENSEKCTMDKTIGENMYVAKIMSEISKTFQIFLTA